ncbi:hypothetical protein [Thermosyntropha lipolytica]|uniref:hypothetical protein n=1 Tax=Thermosyntropha lipolytica TaxID=54294 RepID=UPI0011609DD0|nr:hypothetical protein [Thermosyntropha lipolytica]
MIFDRIPIKLIKQRNSILFLLHANLRLIFNASISPVSLLMIMMGTYKTIENRKIIIKIHTASKNICLIGSRLITSKIASIKAATMPNNTMTPKRILGIIFMLSQNIFWHFIVCTESAFKRFKKIITQSSSKTQ